MNERKQAAYRATLQGRIQDLTQEIYRLDQSGRMDEANLKKAARNIYTQCITLLDTHGDSAAYAAQLDELSVTWRQAREMAETHADYDRAAVEGVKLAALSEARALWEAQREEDQ